MIVGISGKIGSGKDTVALIIQYLTERHKLNTTSFKDYLAYYDAKPEWSLSASPWKIKKFADKLKDIVCLLLNCTREQLEDRDFKEKELGEEWWYYKNEDALKLYPYNDPPMFVSYHTLIKLTPRLLLQLLGTDCGRNIIHPNIWVNALMNEYKISLSAVKGDWRLKHIFPYWIITDIRFSNELAAVKSKKGITLRINRYNQEDGSVYGWGNPNAVHSSETALDNAEFDYTIENTGSIEDLVGKVEQFLKQFKLI